MTKKERIELLIHAYTDDIHSCEVLRKDSQRKVSELQGVICELRSLKIEAENEVRALRLMLTDPEGNWTSGVESHEERRRERHGWFTPEVLQSG